MFNCCSLFFEYLQLYLKHLDFHKSQTTLQVKCNTCGHNSKTWKAFKKHFKNENSKSDLNNYLVTNEESPYTHIIDNTDTIASIKELNDCRDDNLEKEEDRDSIIEAILNQSNN